jgi:hypothetical protein
MLWMLWMMWMRDGGKGTREGRPKSFGRHFLLRRRRLSLSGAVELAWTELLLSEL